MNRVSNKEVATAIIEPENISGQLNDKTRYSSKFYGRLMASDLADQMNKQGVKVSMSSASSGNLWATMLIAFTPFLLIIGFGIFVLHRGYSKDTAIKIDQEVNYIIMEQYGRARRIITEEYEAVERRAQALLERESLNAIQIGRVVAGLPLNA
jgi:ATP-dependent Zn protease